jgi:hypothetical protein
MVRPLTQKLFNAVMMDLYPEGLAVACDFGLDEPEHYEALHGPIRAGEITLEQLDAAICDGPKLTALVKDCPSNPHKSIIFSTMWDDLVDEEDTCVSCGQSMLTESGMVCSACQKKAQDALTI